MGIFQNFPANEIPLDHGPAVQSSNPWQRWESNIDLWYSAVLSSHNQILIFRKIDKVITENQVFDFPLVIFLHFLWIFLDKDWSYLICGNCEDYLLYYPKRFQVWNWSEVIYFIPSLNFYFNGFFLLTKILYSRGLLLHRIIL